MIAIFLVESTVLWDISGMEWQPIETAPLGKMVLLWQPCWRHPFCGQRNGDAGQVWVDTCEPEARGWQAFASYWMPIPEMPA
jgi:hypothetical protein